MSLRSESPLFQRSCTRHVNVSYNSASAGRKRDGTHNFLAEDCGFLVQKQMSSEAGSLQYFALSVSLHPVRWAGLSPSFIHLLPVSLTGGGVQEPRAKTQRTNNHSHRKLNYSRQFAKNRHRLGRNSRPSGFYPCLCVQAQMRIDSALLKVHTHTSIDV